MKQDSELPRDSDDGPLLRVLAPTTCEFEPVAPQNGLWTEGPQDVLSATDQKLAHQRVSGFRDPKLWFAIAGVAAFGSETQIRTDRPALLESLGVGNH